jgi:uridine kinase
MRSDIIIVEEHHLKAAREIVPQLLKAVRNRNRRTTLTVAGESGSGKSETAKALADVFAEHDIKAAIYQQDDYFVLPPRSTRWWMNSHWCSDPVTRVSRQGGRG